MLYHDFIYDTSRNDNEERSAEIAKDKLHLISFPADKTYKCYSQILATKGHMKSNDNDTNLFIDADLSILGQNWIDYSEYTKQIRKEYSIYPDPGYNSGRKNVLSHFLSMDRIYKTDYFYNKYEQEARKNLTQELEGI